MKLPQLKWAALGLILGLGALARWTDLSVHFPHVDDIGVARTIVRVEKSESHASGISRTLRAAHRVPSEWTYAPFQFLFTALLVSPERGYRENLRAGRIPSFLFGTLGLLTFMLLLLEWRVPAPLPLPGVLFGVSLLAFSWENIIYAQQMESYAIGVTSTGALMYLLIRQCRAEISLRTALIGALSLAVLAHTQYQILFFVPGFCAAVLVTHLGQGKRLASLGRPLAAGAALFAALILPMYLLYLRQHADNQVGWSGGGNVYNLHWPYGASLRNQLLYLPRFFVSNFGQVTQSNLLFFPEESPLFTPVSIVFFVLIWFGVRSLFVYRSPEHTALKWFLSVSSTVWILLLFKGSITLGPTRHSLVLLPPIALLCVLGLDVLGRKLAGRHPIRSAGMAGFATAFIVATFWLYQGEVRKSRRDPFDDDRMAGLAEKHNATLVVGYNGLWWLEMMPKLTHARSFQEFAALPPPEWALELAERENVHSIALVSPREALPEAWRTKFKVVYSEEVPSSTETEFLKRTKNGVNGFYFYVVEL